MQKAAFRAWAIDEFGGARLGDERRTSRLVAMATEAAQNPGGRITTVFTRSAERQGAYDFLESKHVAPDAILSAAVEAACRRAD
jgi:hypothetical protein